MRVQPYTFVLSYRCSVIKIIKKNLFTLRSHIVCLFLSVAREKEKNAAQFNIFQCCTCSNFRKASGKKFNLMCKNLFSSRFNRFYTSTKLMMTNGWNRRKILLNFEIRIPQWKSLLKLKFNVFHYDRWSVKILETEWK